MGCLLLVLLVAVIWGPAGVLQSTAVVVLASAIAVLSLLGSLFRFLARRPRG